METMTLTPTAADSPPVAPTAPVAPASGDSLSAHGQATLSPEEEHKARCAAGRARKLISDTRKAREHVRTARALAVDGLTGDERKDAARDFSDERRKALSRALDGAKVPLLLEHVTYTKRGTQRVNATGSLVLKDGMDAVTVLVKGEIGVLDSIETADGAVFEVILRRVVGLDKATGRETYRYHVSQAGEARFKTRKGRCHVSGTLTASEFVRVAVSVAVAD